MSNFGATDHEPLEDNRELRAGTGAGDHIRLIMLIGCCLAVPAGLLATAVGEAQGLNAPWLWLSFAVVLACGITYLHLGPPRRP